MMMGRWWWCGGSGDDGGGRHSSSSCSNGSRHLNKNKRNVKITKTEYEKSAQRDANTARALVVVRFRHRPPATNTYTHTNRQDRLQYTVLLVPRAQCKNKIETMDHHHHQTQAIISWCIRITGNVLTKSPTFFNYPWSGCS